MPIQVGKKFHLFDKSWFLCCYANEVGTARDGKASSLCLDVLPSLKFILDRKDIT